MPIVKKVKSRVPEFTHPIWDILRLAVVLLGLTFLLWLNASYFDHSEITIILEFVGILGFSEVMQYIKQKKLLTKNKLISK